MAERFLLHSRWAATAPYRVRIGLCLKALPFDVAAVNLADGEQRSAAYRSLNAQALVPALETSHGVLTQSLAILEWLDETHPHPPLLPSDPDGRAIVRTMAQIVACDIHPLNNLRVMQALGELGHPQGSAESVAWGARWINEGFAALEPMVARYGGGFAFGGAPTLADCCLVPQIWSSRRFGVDVSAYPALSAVAAHAANHPAFIEAHPERQPDAPPRR
jgi:maleylacetoacetate isomerase/maleylpyruvate isomerase